MGSDQLLTLKRFYTGGNGNLTGDAERFSVPYIRKGDLLRVKNETPRVGHGREG